MDLDDAIMLIKQKDEKLKVLEDQVQNLLTEVAVRREVFVSLYNVADTPHRLAAFDTLRAKGYNL